jgi:hypothetical protein
VIRPAILQITPADVYSAAHGLLSAQAVKSRS